ncbi:hypothetical protein ACFC0M_01565 [Streptomyces sp. NPDC056149]|uniref:hypothetical protein n=1 Tax=unclassified Streptomyces TaxID=2593676 RepID=UPI00238150B7|nr:hypothetical protein [Streptomyces sp. WZ-12]
MPTTIELTDLDDLIGDLDARITESELPDAQGITLLCSDVGGCESVPYCSAYYC